MGIARKFTLALVTCVIVALSINAFWTVRDEVSRFEQEAAAHQVITGRALRPAITSVWTVEGKSRALAIVREADQRLRRVEIRWVWVDRTEEGFQPIVDRGRLEPLKKGEDVVIVDEAGSRLVTYVPVPAPPSDAADGPGVGALEISQSLERRAEFRNSALRQAVFLVLGVTLLLAIATSLLGAFFVGRPLATFVEQMRRIGRGDLSYRIPVTARARDEFAPLAEEMNRMSDRLLESQELAKHANDAQIRAIEQLRHADRLATVGRLAAGMAHELGTPLNVVSARAKPIWTGRVEGDQAKDNARIVVEQVDRMAKIMRQLLDFARKRELAKTSADLTAGVRRVVALLEPLAHKNGIALVVDDPPETPSARFDPAQMDQVVTNLVINAIHASPRGSTVRVQLARESAASAIDGHPDPLPCAVVRVIDAGTGIPQEQLPRIFEPFFTTKEIGEGTGLGLSVAYGIVKDHGGWIHVDSKPGKGSTFSVTIPEEKA